MIKAIAALYLFQALLCNSVAFAQKSASRANVAVYWGQGPNQKRLLHFCQQSTVDIIILSFIHVFPEQGNGYPGSNFGNQCSGSVFAGPGPDPSRNQLQSSCPYIVQDISVCQKTYGKKILLSLGGGTNTYALNGASNGVAFADFLFGAFGPQKAAWLNAGKPRPFDGPNRQATEVDGYDFDIEFQATDSSAGYIAMINRLRSLYSTQNPSKKLLITGAPQCIVPDANMSEMISKAQFDILFVQFYNTPQCSARSWADANPRYPARRERSSGFRDSYNAWEASLANTASKNAKIFIGIPGSKQAVSDPINYVPSSIVAKLLRAYFCRPRFAGVMIWEATYADDGQVGDGSGNFYQYVKRTLNKLAADRRSGCYGR